MVIEIPCILLIAVNYYVFVINRQNFNFYKEAENSFELSAWQTK